MKANFSLLFLGMAMIAGIDLANSADAGVSATEFTQVVDGQTEVIAQSTNSPGDVRQASDQEKVPWKREPFRIGGEIMESKLIHKVDPVYPVEALKAQISGSVILKVTVNKKGFVSDVRVLSGHPLLRKATVEAVRQWQYSPTFLNGKAVGVIATVTVIFRPDPKSAPVDL
jgi:TonB family protein